MGFDANNLNAKQALKVTALMLLIGLGGSAVWIYLDEASPLKKNDAENFVKEEIEQKMPNVLYEILETRRYPGGAAVVAQSGARTNPTYWVYYLVDGNNESAHGFKDGSFSKYGYAITYNLTMKETRPTETDIARGAAESGLTPKPAAPPPPPPPPPVNRPPVAAAPVKSDADLAADFLLAKWRKEAADKGLTGEAVDKYVQDRAVEIKNKDLDITKSPQGKILDVKVL